MTLGKHTSLKVISQLEKKLDETISSRFGIWSPQIKLPFFRWWNSCPSMLMRIVALSEVKSRPIIQVVPAFQNYSDS